MRFVDEFNEVDIVKKMLEKLVLECDRELRIMEVCGTHTMAIFKTGIRDVLTDSIKLISGPGCPVCVTPQGYIDTAIELLQNKDIIITTFADMMKVPGTGSSLLEQKAAGAAIRMVYSPLDVLNIAQDNPDKEVIFLAVGFETTIPTIALSIKKAEELNLDNFSILQSLKTMPAVMNLLAEDKELGIDGFLCPGHVSTIIGVRPYEFLADKYGLSAVIAGFESGDIVYALYKLVKMIKNKVNKVKNTYSRLVNYQGHESALKLITDIFEVCNSSWRGIGNVSGSGLRLKDNYNKFSAEKRFDIQINVKNINGKCRCGDILKGKILPPECQLFAGKCVPENPQGACMVSREGSCSIFYKYRKH